MKPIDFPGSNGVRTAPEDMPDCLPLPVFSDGAQCISCWEPTPEERAEIDAGAPVFLSVVTGHTQPPVCVWVNTPPRPIALDLPVEEMALLDFVRWDRYVSRPERVTVFGWIDRPGDTWKDFVLLYVVPSGVGYATSSAEYSEEIGRLLRGEEPAEPGQGHADCERVQLHPRAGELRNVVCLPTVVD